MTGSVATSLYYLLFGDAQHDAKGNLLLLLRHDLGRVGGILQDQIAGLIDGSADILMIENIIDTLNPKVVVYAVDEYFDDTSKERLPVMFSEKIVDTRGHTYLVRRWKFST